MFEGLSPQGILIVVGALLFGFGFVRLMLTSKKEDEASDAYGKHPYDFTEEKIGESWFEILEVDSKATLDEIKSAYKKKISQYHPDKVSSLGPEFTLIAEEKTKQLNTAYAEAEKRFGI
jgi:DnaJ-domain-containing protein 1